MVLNLSLYHSPKIYLRLATVEYLYRYYGLLKDDLFLKFRIWRLIVFNMKSAFEFRIIVIVYLQNQNNDKLIKNMFRHIDEYFGYLNLKKRFF